MQLPEIGIPGVSFYYRKDRRRYVVQFTKDGRRKKITLQTTNAARAFKEALDYAERFDAGRFDPWKPVVRNQVLTVKEAIEKYLKAITHLRRATINQRTTVLNALESTLPAHTPLRELSMRHLSSYYMGSNLASASQQTYFNVLSTWLNWCVKKGFLEISPLKDVPRPRVARGLPAYFTPEQYKRLMDHVLSEVTLQKTRLSGAAADSGIEDYPDIIALAVNTGLRRGELLHLRWMDVDFRSKLIHVRAYEDRKRGFSFNPKDTDSRVVPISPAARSILDRRKEALADEDDTRLVFPSPRGNGPRDRKSVTRTIRRLIDDAGLPHTLHLHSLRHTFASWLASGGTPIVTIQKWMGHESVEQTMVYAALLPSALEWRGSVYHDMAFKPMEETHGGLHNEARNGESNPSKRE